MIKYNEIMVAFGMDLKKNFNCKLRAKKNLEEIKEPTFYVEVRALNSNAFKNYIDKLVNISITYTDKNIDNEKLNNVLNELESIFDLGIKIKDTFFIFKNKQINYDDNFITLNVTINFKDEPMTIDENDYYSALMEELYIDYN